MMLRVIRDSLPDITSQPSYFKCLDHKNALLGFFSIRDNQATPQ